MSSIYIIVLYSINSTCEMVQVTLAIEEGIVWREDTCCLKMTPITNYKYIMNKVYRGHKSEHKLFFCFNQNYPRQGLLRL